LGVSISTFSSDEWRSNYDRWKISAGIHCNFYFLTRFYTLKISQTNADFSKSRGWAT
jgi:hypothetical protein